MDIMQFIGENTYVVAAALWVLGGFIKAAPKIPDWTIPFALTAAGVGLCAGLMGFSVQAAMQGILCAGGAVLIDQGRKQVKKAKEGE